MTENRLSGQAVRRSLRLAACVLGIAMGSANSLTAQAGSVSGSIVASPDGEGLSGAEVSVVGQDVLSVTGADGLFSLSVLETGRITLLIRRIGYRPLSVALRIDTGQQLVITSPIVLLPDPTVLEEIVAEAEPFDRRYRLLDFDRRRFRGIGRFLTQEQIEKRDPHFVTDFFREMAGVGIESMRTGQRVVTFRRGVWPCIPTVYLNGMQIRGESLTDDGLPGGASIFGSGESSTIGFGLQRAELNSPRFENRAPVDLDRLISARELAGIEVYSGLAEIPVEFQDTGNTCGAVVLWTR